MVTKIKDLKLSPDVIVLKRSEDQLVIIHSSNNEKFFQISGDIACHSFDMLTKGKSKEQVIKGLIKKFSDAPLKQLEIDLNSFINKLESLKILG
ncbi:MAG: hypothetical protein K2Q18_09915 [Bdellovibrionales bacterium]|nr:hypothetical protein [Bdellovibrionales bacterium]